MEEEKWMSVQPCCGNKEAFKTGSHARAKLGEVGVIVLIYTIMHGFCWVRNRPVLKSPALWYMVSQCRASNRLAWCERPNKARYVVMLQLWAQGPDLTTAGVWVSQRRLTFFWICSLTCFRLGGDNLNENPPSSAPPSIMHMDVQALEHKPARCNCIVR